MKLISFLNPPKLQRYPAAVTEIIITLILFLFPPENLLAMAIIKGKSRIENQGKNRKCINERQCRVNIIYDRKHRHIRIFDRRNVREQRKRCSKNNHSNHESAKKPAHYPYDKRKALQSKQRTCSWKKPMRYLRRQRLLASYGQSSPLLPQNILASLPQRRNLSANVGTNPSVV